MLTVVKFYLYFWRIASFDGLLMYFWNFTELHVFDFGNTVRYKKVIYVGISRVNIKVAVLFFFLTGTSRGDEKERGENGETNE